MATTNMNDDKALHLLISWFSPSFPIGGYCYSHGLEQVISDGLVGTEAELSSWIADVLVAGSGRKDAILLSESWKARSDRRVMEIAHYAEALSPSRERHRETMELGKAFALTVNSVLGYSLAPMAYPVVAGRAASMSGCPLPDTLRFFLHAFAAGLVSAAVRFMPLGQTSGQRVLNSLFDTCDRVADSAAGAGLDEIGGCAFLSDIASMKHETMNPRIFLT